jgi:hypothetical protein
MPPKNSTKSKKEDESDDEIVLSKRSEKGEVKHVRTSSSAASTPSSKSKDKKKHKHKKQAENDDSQSDNENKMDVDEPAKGSSGPAKATKYSAGENDEASFDDALGYVVHFTSQLLSKFISPPAEGFFVSLRSFMF